MPRVRKQSHKARNEVADAMADFVASAGTKDKKATGIARQIRETNAMMQSDDWSSAKATHLVALYVILHEIV